MTTGVVTNDSYAKKTPLELPDSPGEDGFLAHDGAVWKEKAEARLVTTHHLAIANGLDPPSVKAIIDIDLTELPELPTDHRDYNRRHESRIKILAQNKSNAERRFDLRMTAWTELYAKLKACTENNAPVLSRELTTLCDLWVTRKLPGGYITSTVCVHGALSLVELKVASARRRTKTFTVPPSGCNAPLRSRTAVPQPSTLNALSRS